MAPYWGVGPETADHAAGRGEAEQEKAAPGIAEEFGQLGFRG